MWRKRVDALILLDQVDLPETGVITTRVKDAVSSALQSNPGLIVLADSRRGLARFSSHGLQDERRGARRGWRALRSSESTP